MTSYALQNDSLEQYHEDALQAPRDIESAHNWRVDQNAEAIYAAMQQAQYDDRFDQLNVDSRDMSAQAFHFARELEHVYQETLREQYAPNNAFELWDIDSRPSAGAKTHTVKRVSHTGQARYYRGNSSDRGATGAEQREKEFPIHPIVTTVKFDFFDDLASQFAQSGLKEELQYAAHQTIRDFKNDKTFEGDEEHGVYGIKNYPWTPKTVSSVEFTRMADPNEMLAELHRLASYATITSKQTHQPNRLVMGTRKHKVISQTKRSATTDQTVKQAFLEDNEEIRSIVSVHEFDDAGPGGSDMMFFDRENDRRSMANVIPQGFSMLPVQRTGFEFEIPCYMLDGGVIQRDPLNNLLVFVQ